MVLEAPHREKSLFISALKSLRGGLLQARAGKGRMEVLHRYPADGEPRALVLLTGPAPEAPAWQGRVAKADLYAFLLEGTVPRNPSGGPFPSFPTEGRPAGSLTTASLDYAARALSPVVAPGTHILHDYRLEARGQEGVVDLDPRLGLLGDEGGFYPEASYRLLTPLWRGIAGAPEGFEDLIRVVEVWEAEAEGNLEGYHTWASERFGLYRDLARFLEVR